MNMLEWLVWTSVLVVFVIGIYLRYEHKIKEALRILKR